MAYSSSKRAVIMNKHFALHAQFQNDNIYSNIKPWKAQQAARQKKVSKISLWADALMFGRILHNKPEQASTAYYLACNFKTTVQA